MTKNEQIEQLRDALGEMVNEPQPLGIDRPAYQAAVQTLLATEAPALDELPAEGTELYFEDERWQVVDYRVSILGHCDLAIHLARINDKPPVKSSDFELTSP